MKRRTKPTGNNYYRIVRGTSTTVANAADRLMADGWMPFGPPFWTGQKVVSSDVPVNELAQALIRPQPVSIPQAPFLPVKERKNGHE